MLRAVLLIALAWPHGAAHAAGPLVIVGGGLRADNETVHRAVIDAAGTGRVVIIPAASGYPATSASAFAERLTAFGLPAERIVVAHVALRDDPDTPGDDESRWSRGAFDPVEVAKVDGAGAIWFLGGDQSRITGALIDRNGVPSPMLAAIRRAHAAGAAVGGTSAGAAMMSATMIAQGSGVAAFVDSAGQGAADEGEGASEEPLRLTPGLGFFSAGLVDQHFGERMRLPRLVRAMALANERLGFGIDEDTALVVRGDGTAGVAGRGHVTIIDRADAAPMQPAAPLRLSLARTGDVIRLADGSVTPKGEAMQAGAKSGAAVPRLRLAEPTLASMLAESFAAPVQWLWAVRDSDAVVVAIQADALSRRWRSADGEPHSFDRMAVRVLHQRLVLGSQEH